MDFMEGVSMGVLGKDLVKWGGFDGGERGFGIGRVNEND